MPRGQLVLPREATDRQPQRLFDTDNVIVSGEDLADLATGQARPASQLIPSEGKMVILCQSSRSMLTWR